MFLNKLQKCDRDQKTTMNSVTYCRLKVVLDEYFLRNIRTIAHFFKTVLAINIE